MANVVVVGAQWGDEGKGKIVDWLSERADVIAAARLNSHPFSPVKSLVKSLCWMVRNAWRQLLLLWIRL